MFEDATFESTGIIHTRSRTWMVATFLFNGSILLTLILIPLTDPEALPQQALPFLLTAPAPLPPPPLAPSITARPTQGKSEMLNGVIPAPPGILQSIRISDRPGGAESLMSMGEGPSRSDAATVVFLGTQAIHVVHSDVRGPVRVSSITAGASLIRRTLPVYPPIAISLHLEGTVVLQATISKSGAIEDLRVASGPALLQQAALDAVKTWRYRPYLLNGEPVEVETTVNVVFKMGQ